LPGKTGQCKTAEKVTTLMNDIRRWVKDSRIDILALDRDGNPVLLVEVKGSRQINEPRKKEILSYLNDLAKKFSVPFIMIVDLDNIDVYSSENNPDAKWFKSPLLEVATNKILLEYDPDFSRKLSGKGKIFSHYLERLTEGWLRDIAYHWKSVSPPLSSKLQEIGLADKLNNGTTLSESCISR